MELYQRKRRDASIVLIGTFFPILLTPEWFVRNKLLPSEDAESNIAVDIINKELTKFSLASISIEVQEEKLILRSSEEYFDFLIRDLAIGVLTLLPEIKVTALGLNVAADIECLETDFWHYIGDTLAPKDVWTEALPDSPRIGLKNLQLQAARPKNSQSVHNIGVSWLKVPRWLQFSLNHHFGYDDEKNTHENEKDFNALQIIKENWDSTLETYEGVFGHVMGSLSEGFKR